MSKKLIVSLMALTMVFLLSLVVNAGSWAITSNSSYTYFGSWVRVRTVYNYDYNLTDYITVSVNQSNTFTIVTEDAGLIPTIEKKLGMEDGTVITKTASYTATVHPRKYRNIDYRWNWKRNYGYADYTGDWWNPLDDNKSDVYWYAKTPNFIEMRASQEYSF